MNKNYIILMGILILLAAGLLVLPLKNNSKQLDPEVLMWDIVQPTRYVSTDEVAKMIIEHDPLLVMVDVRSAEDFQLFSLTSAINFPLDSLALDDAKSALTFNKRNLVFYSNDDLKSDQAWVIAKRLGLKNIYVLKGGLNRWIQTIIQPEAPLETASEVEFNLYAFRQGASQYFTGGSISIDQNPQVEVVVSRKKKAKAVEGGC
ncbi:MAG: rhodanese-like domain-containing protein [Bacteroidetes bacterium]|nr:rhodanese-like domain-containing protein [Bacteroidota bacterium]